MSSRGQNARIHDDGSTDSLRDALTGLYKLAGVDLVREQVEAWLGQSRFGYDITAEGLVVWPRQEYEEQVVYALGLGEGRGRRRRSQGSEL